MDLSPLFQSAERIAAALERIAAAVTRPVVFEESSIQVTEAWKPNLDELLASFGTTLTEEPIRIPEAPKVPALPAPEPEAAGESIEDWIRALHEGGKTSYTAIAKSLNAKGLLNPHGRPFNPPYVKDVMARIGLQSPHRYTGTATRKRRKDEPETPFEAVAPEPEAPKKVWVERPAPPPETDPMDMRDMLGPKTRARLETFEQARKEGRPPTDAELVAAAIAAGKVTRLPAGVDSDGYNHLTGEQA